MKRIPLTQGKYALVDDSDFEWLNQYKWYAYKSANTYYARRNEKKENGKQVTIIMHVALLGKKDGHEIDHENGNGLDNQRNNLRHVTHRQNQQNLHIKTASKYPGVSWFRPLQRWRARIKILGRTKYLGYYTNELDAFSAYKTAVRELVGEEVI